MEICHNNTAHVAVTVFNNINPDGLDMDILYNYNRVWGGSFAAGNKEVCHGHTSICEDSR